MEYQVLLGLRTIRLVEGLPLSVRTRIYARLERLEIFPHNCSEFTENDDSGRLHDVTLCAGYAIFYWIDFADRQVKISKIEPAGT